LLPGEIDVEESIGHWYLFAWADDRGGFANWILVDLDRLRDSALMDSQRITYNRDWETGFIAIKIADLRANGCIVDQKEGMVQQLELGLLSASGE
jgi:predicted DNA-binding transcriptional regulator YafY